MKYRIFIIISLLLCLFVAKSACALTIEEEKKAGKEVFDNLEKHGYLVHNARVENYISALGKRLLTSTKPIFDFRFSVIKSSGINAFATPGGYVYVFQGLINLVETESELAGVLAHEIAHVNARHIADITEKSGKISIATLAALLAGAVLGGGGQGTAAIAAMTMATAAHMSLKYSRDHEEEADRIGTANLIQAGYEGKAMIDFLKIMRRYEFYSNTIPSYFLTHPGTDERIRYLDGLLQTTYRRQSGEKSILGGLKRIQAILALDNKNLDTVLRKYEDDLKKNPGDLDTLYGLALVQEKMGLMAPALGNFQKALQLAPEDEDIIRDTGIIYFRAGYPKEAADLLRKAYGLNGNNENTLSYLAKAYEATNDYASALDLYRKLEKKKIDDVDIYYNMAMAYGKTNHPGESHYNFGLFFKKKNKRDSALFHFKAALPYFSKDNERSLEIENEIKALKK
ncbi:MAG: M48 family metalloprotease [Syntrophales bacterium]|nr:M48 family metalloprotease [Syntrophales bacterium]